MASRHHFTLGFGKTGGSLVQPLDRSFVQVKVTLTVAIRWPYYHIKFTPPTNLPGSAAQRAFAYAREARVFPERIQIRIDRLEGKKAEFSWTARPNS